MILAIDTGNTHTVIGCINPDGEIATLCGWRAISIRQSMNMQRV